MPRKKNSSAKKPPLYTKAGAAPMPSLVFNGASFDPPKKRKASPTPIPEATEDSEALRAYEQMLKRDASARRILWIGVISFMIVIGVLWGWSLKLQITAVRWDGSAEQNFIEQNKQNWEAAFKVTEPTPTIGEAEQKIKDTIALILENASSTQSSATSTTTTTR